MPGNYVNKQAWSFYESFNGVSEVEMVVMFKNGRGARNTRAGFALVVFEAVIFFLEMN